MTTQMRDRPILTRQLGRALYAGLGVTAIGLASSAPIAALGMIVVTIVVALVIERAVERADDREMEDLYRRARERYARTRRSPPTP